MRPKIRYLGWDLDETIGAFRPGNRVRAADGMLPLLESLQRRSCRHVITTAADEGYARSGLRAAGLDGAFDAVFGGSSVWKGGPGKAYRGVVRELGLPEHEAEDRMVLIGNSEIDIPTDIDLVTIVHPYAMASGTAVLEAVLGRLLSASSVWWGYESMLHGCADRWHNEYFDGGSLAVMGSRVFIGRIKENPLVSQAERLICIGGRA